MLSVGNWRDVLVVARKGAGHLGRVRTGSRNETHRTALGPRRKRRRACRRHTQGQRTCMEHRQSQLVLPELQRKLYARRHPGG